MSTIDHSTILNLPVAERLQLLDELWDSLSRESTGVDASPAPAAEGGVAPVPSVRDERIADTDLAHE